MANELSSLLSLSNSLADLVQTVAPRVVSVAARGRRPSSGIAVGGDLVITADHTVERDRDISVLVDGQAREATLAGRDPASDLAAIRVTGLDVPAAPFAETPRTGALAVSVSRTGSGTVSAGLGVITSVGGPLRTPNGVVLPAIIRTDAALRPGISGGALVDASGAILGMTTAGLLRGLPVAIPLREAKGIADRLAARQPLGRGYLGVGVHGAALTPRQERVAATDRGLLVLGVTAGGAAEAAGLLVGDVLLRFDGRQLSRPDDLQDSLVGIAPGTSATVAVLRGDAVKDVSITIGERPAA